MQSHPVKAGEVVIRQGDPGDYFYTIHEGRCAVTRKESPDSEAEFLAELASGASFGEDALISDAKRNATVTMLTNGLLMRLAKEDFVELLKNQLVKRVEHEQAVGMVDEGAVWIDVRTADEYESGSFEDSVNIPLSYLRDEMSELMFNTKYIICCDTGRRSESAGFLLSHKGFDVYVLEGGIPKSSLEAADAENCDEPVADAESDSQDAAENDLVPGVSAVHGQEIESLRADNEKLLAEIKENKSAEARMKEQIEQLRGELGESSDIQSELYARTKTDAELLTQLRGELCESGEKLGLLYAHAKRDAEEMQLLQARYAALQEQHADVVSAHKLELEEQLNENCSRADSAWAECCVLEKATECVSELEPDLVKSDEAGTE
jgi:rhodanese-related sulfurtransferase